MNTLKRGESAVRQFVAFQQCCHLYMFTSDAQYTSLTYKSVIWRLHQVISWSLWSQCTSVGIRPHRHSSLNCAHRCLNQPIVVTSVQLLGVTLQFHAPEQWDTAKYILLFLIQHSGTHSHCLWSIADTDSVLCTSEDCVILQSIRNTSIAPTWQFRL